ncbi:hypothetical protein NKI80_07235 [Mesorhizobium sp. M0387]|uniref:hypothetical protein n=1 Tax=Mesorhizobium sp. M0387 TaxID=2956940 RepID=UPI0033388A33
MANVNDEAKVEHVAKAMREAYAKETGEVPLIPWEMSRASHAWLTCARAALDAERKFEAEKTA